jgi:hypothetical protein
MQQNKKLILLVGLILILVVKFIIRPFVLVPPTFHLFQDVAPNLISAFLIPFGADVVLKRWIPMAEKGIVFWVCLGGLMIITLNELAQLFPVFRRTFDYNDLVFSIIGVGFGYLIFTKYFMDPISSESPIHNNDRPL